jgi:hypothetical protein
MDDTVRVDIFVSFVCLLVVEGAIVYCSFGFSVVGGTVAIAVEGFSVDLVVVGGTADEEVVADSFGFRVEEGTVALGFEGFSVDLLVVGSTATEGW